jgi:hypothetical protein
MLEDVDDRDEEFEAPQDDLDAEPIKRSEVCSLFFF